MKARPTVRRGILPRERHQRRVVLDPHSMQAGHTRGEAEQRRTCAASALEDPRALAYRHRRRKQHGLDTAAETRPRLVIANPPAEQMTVGQRASVLAMRGCLDWIHRSVRFVQLAFFGVPGVTGVAWFSVRGLTLAGRLGPTMPPGVPDGNEQGRRCSGYVKGQGGGDILTALAPGNRTAARVIADRFAAWHD